MSIPPRSRPKTFALADLTAKAMDPVLAKQGFGAADIVLNWDEIVGERLARVCEPIKLQWPTRAPKAEPGDVEPASLIVRVESGFAIELQHVGATIIDRVNMHLGWRCVGAKARLAKQKSQAASNRHLTLWRANKQPAKWHRLRMRACVMRSRAWASACSLKNAQKADPCASSFILPHSSGI